MGSKIIIVIHRHPQHEQCHECVAGALRDLFFKDEGSFSAIG